MKAIVAKLGVAGRSELTALLLDQLPAPTLTRRPVSFRQQQAYGADKPNIGK